MGLRHLLRNVYEDGLESEGWSNDGMRLGMHSRGLV